MDERILEDVSALRRREGKKSLYAFAKHYLSNHVSVEPSQAHLEIYDLLYDITSQRDKKVAIAAPRDFGKSTMITLVYIIYLICYSKEHFIVIISNTTGQAVKILDNIRRELTENERLRQDFPEIFETKGCPKPPRWTEEDIVTRNKIEILALGSGQQIRGRKHGEHRPTLVILDDLESGENTFSQESKEKMKMWFERSVLKSGSTSTNYLFIGTVHNSLSLLGEYLSPEAGPSWQGRKHRAIVAWPKNMNLWERCWKIRCGIIDYNGAYGLSAAKLYYHDNKADMDDGAVVLWPQKWQLYALMEMYAENELSFSSEMQNDPMDTKNMSFNVENFAYWDKEYPSVDALLRGLGDKVCFYGACDPALLGGDYTAIIVLARWDEHYYVIVADIAQRDEDAIIKDIIAYSQRYTFTSFAVETNAFQKLLLDALEKEARAQHVTLYLTSIKNTANKQRRILSLYTWVKNRSIKFCKSDKMLLDQFRQFPRCKHDDGLDALEMAVRVCNEQHSGKLEVYCTEKKDIFPQYMGLGDDNDRSEDGYFSGEDHPSPNAKEIDFL